MAAEAQDRGAGGGASATTASGAAETVGVAELGSVVDALCERASAAGEGRCWWVALAGAPGSGKSTVGARIVEELRARGVRALALPMDGYHFTKERLRQFEDAEEAFRRRGAHWTFDGERFVHDLVAAKQAQRARRAQRRDGGENADAAVAWFPSFDHAVGDPVEEDIALRADVEVVLVEGNYVMLWDREPWAQLQQQGVFDEAWFVDAPRDVLRRRLIARHVAAWGNTGFTEEDAAQRADDNDLPNADLVVACSRGFADVVIDNEADAGNRVAAQKNVDGKEAR